MCVALQGAAGESGTAGQRGPTVSITNNHIPVCTFQGVLKFARRVELSLHCLENAGQL